MKTVATKTEFDQLISTEKNLIVVDFFATWCGPCKAIAPHLQKWSEEFEGEVLFVKIDVDENDETAEACGVTAMPTFFLYKNGKKVDEIVGANAEKLKEKIIANK
ncbi:thioredoxin trx1 [Bulinus truncatus]|nr:thioredoxin trx1 [Bulinus truncatus]